ncbi:ABC transporter permease [Micromonospora sp. NBC_01796]|uniref:ABC transporter permease n=1 Tax=Micromonospora sp. NBC_01796 TaxID=2975987 RepID=UPI002DDA5200|nr:ABC transporter permease [Micromonospora sp. NBC_01796]WSA86418.1 ABC transporter permease [Micromonospora sp. NBC_01796]
MTTTTTTTTPTRPVDSDALRTVLATRDRPPRPSALSASVTFGWRAMRKIQHVPEQLFDVTIFPVMLTLIFTYLLGGALAGSPREYLQYLLPGILLQTVVMITMYTGMTLNNDIAKGIFDRFRTLPIWRPSAIVGALLGDAVRYALASVVVLGLGLALGFRPGGGVFGVLLGVLLVLVFSFSLTWVWTMFGLLLRTQNSVMGVSMLVLFPLTFGSNIFVDPGTMPGWLEAAVRANPISHASTAVRGLMAGTVTAGQLVAVLLTCAVLVGVFGPVTMYLYRNKR